MFCPPREPKLPPTNPISARPHQALSSPTVSTSRIRFSLGGVSASCSKLRRCQRSCFAFSNLATSSKRSGCRGTSTSLRCGTSFWRVQNVLIASDSSGCCVLPARKIISCGWCPASLAKLVVAGFLRSLSAPSNLIDPVTLTCSVAAPRSRNRSAYSVFCTAIISRLRSIFPTRGCRRRYPRKLFSPNRPLMTAVAIPKRCVVKIRFGHSSNSLNTKRSGRMRRMALRTAQVKSSGQ